MNSIDRPLLLLRLVCRHRDTLVRGNGRVRHHHMLPGDVAQELLGQSATPEAVAGLRKALGLDVPPLQRYLSWLGRTCSPAIRAIARQRHARRNADRFAIWQFTHTGQRNGGRGRARRHSLLGIAAAASRGRDFRPHRRGRHDTRLFRCLNSWSRRLPGVDLRRPSQVGAGPLAIRTASMARGISFAYSRSPYSR